MKTLVLQPADQMVSGVVVDPNGNPAAEVPVFTSRGPDNDDQPRRTTTTDEKGKFVVNRICAGQIRLQANTPRSPGGAGYAIAEGGDQNIKIILGQQGVHSK
jgi:hypothetical protein